MQFQKIYKRVLCSGIIAGSLFFAAPCSFAQSSVEYMTNFAGIPISCSIKESQAVVGGIHGNDSPEKVKSLIGQPSNISIDNKYGNYIDYTYPGILVRFWNIGTDEKYRVCALSVSTKGYFTPDGVGVGMSADVLTQIYGTADVVYTEKSVAPKLSTDQQAKYRKLGKTIYTYNVSAGLALQFEVRNDKISKIELMTAK